MSSQFTNNYMTTLTSSNPYITKKLNNMDKAKLFRKNVMTRLNYTTRH